MIRPASKELVNLAPNSGKDVINNPRPKGGNNPNGPAGYQPWNPSLGQLEQSNTRQVRGSQASESEVKQSPEARVLRYFQKHINQGGSMLEFDSVTDPNFRQLAAEMTLVSGDDDEGNFFALAALGTQDPRYFSFASQLIGRNGELALSPKKLDQVLNAVNKEMRTKDAWNEILQKGQKVSGILFNDNDIAAEFIRSGRLGSEDTVVASETEVIREARSLAFRTFEKIHFGDNEEVAKDLRTLFGALRVLRNTTYAGLEREITAEEKGIELSDKELSDMHNQYLLAERLWNNTLKRLGLDPESPKLRAVAEFYGALKNNGSR